MPILQDSLVSKTSSLSSEVLKYDDKKISINVYFAENHKGFVVDMEDKNPLNEEAKNFFIKIGNDDKKIASEIFKFCSTLAENNHPIQRIDYEVKARIESNHVKEKVNTTLALPLEKALLALDKLWLTWEIAISHPIFKKIIELLWWENDKDIPEWWGKVEDLDEMMENFWIPTTRKELESILSWKKSDKSTKKERIPRKKEKIKGQNK